jgi:hypothetical protein
MAETPGRNKSIDELTAEIVSSRERVGRELRGLRHELDFPAKFRRSFREQTVSWITAAAAVGALIALAPMRKKKIYVDAKSSRKSQKKLLETGFALAALKVVAGLARPVIVELHQIVDNALAEITLSQLLGTEANVDAALHQIQGSKQRDNRL